MTRRSHLPLALLVVAALGAAAVAGSLGSAPAGGQAATTGAFSSLTYNVAGLPEGLSGSEPATNTPLISPLLNAYDLVLVQEDWVDPVPPVPPFDFFHDDLIAQVDHPYRSTPATPPVGTDPRRPGALVADGLNRLSRFPFGEITREMWTDCFGGIDTSDGGAGDCLALKGFSVARTTLAPGVEVDVYNLHGEAGSTALDEQYRAADYVQLAEFVTAYSAGRAVVVGGDFNLHTDEEPDATVFEQLQADTGLVDVCDVVDCGDDAHEIDKFLFRDGGGVALEPLSHRFERERFMRSDGEPLSDHDALHVEWSYELAASDPGTEDPGGDPSGSAGLPAAVPASAAAVPVSTAPRFTG